MAVSRVEAFASEARRFAAWAVGADLPPATPLEALVRLLALYAAGVELDAPLTRDEVADIPPIENSERSIEAVIARIAPFGARQYASIFDPYETPPARAEGRDLAEDVSEVFRDVIRGLALFDAGRDREAQVFWAHRLRVHWGEHATSAIHALHWTALEEELP